MAAQPFAPHAFRLATALVATALVVAACGNGESEPSGRNAGEQASEPTAFTVVLPVESPIHYGFWIADEVGYYAEEGVEPRFQIVDGDGAAIQQLIAGRADLADVGVPTVVEALEEGHTDLRPVFNYAYGSIFYLVAPEDGDVESADDLAGKKIGVTDLSGGEVPIVRGIVRSAGLSEQDVELVPVGEGTALTVRAITEGQVDAFGGAVNDIVSVEVQGLDLRAIIPDELAELPSSGIVVREETLAEDRDAIAGFLRATAKGYEFGRANEEAAIAILRRAMPAQFTDETGEGIFEAILPLTQAPAGTTFGTQSAESWEKFFDFIGAEHPDVDLSEIIVPDLVGPANDYDADEVVEDARTFEG